MDRNKIEEFWRKLSPLLKEVLSDSENAQLIQKIDYLVGDFCNFDWEYGPSSNTDFYFCLSPSLRVDLMPGVEQVISLAPDLKGWEFIVGKPRKEEMLNWSMFNEDDEEILIDIHHWKCVVYKFPDHTVDLDVKVEDVNGNEDTQYLAVDICLTNVLGEVNYMNVVKHVNIVHELSSEELAKSILVTDLFKVITRHIPGTTGR